MIVSRFEDMVKKNPHAVAVTSAEKVYSYGAINAWANALSRELEELSVPGERAELLFGHSASMIGALMGVLKKNMAFVPLPSHYPQSRLREMAGHATLSALVTDGPNKIVAEEIGSALGIPVIDSDHIPCPTPMDNPVRPPIAAGGAAYILYTSGSTGMPKGVVQTMENVSHFIRQYRKDLEITAQDALTGLSVLGHDAAIMDIFGALLAGASLHLWDFRQRGGATEMVAWLKEKRITLWHSVPTVFRHVFADLKDGLTVPHVRRVVLGGEAVGPGDIRLCRQFFPNAEFHNLYGQTESSYNALWRILPDAADMEIMVGTPVENTEIIVIDGEGNEADLLKTGEIVIRSPYLSPGYHGDPDATRAVFLPDVDGESPFRLYLTGDLGRVLPDGVQYVGRKDAQLKIRGERVEPAEVEQVILSHSGTRECVVFGTKRPGHETVLVACLVAETSVSKQELVGFLQDLLPDYMIPAYIVFLSAMPLLENNKIDRKALSAMTPWEDRKLEPGHAPLTGPAQILARLWATLIGMDPDHITEHSNFFDLGGHSLTAIRLSALIGRTFHVTLTVKDIFEAPTVLEMATRIKSAVKATPMPIRRVKNRRYYPVSSQQKGLYVLHALDGIGHSYHLTYGVIIRGRTPGEARRLFSKDRLEPVFHHLVRRHDCFRTSFSFQEDAPVQTIHDEVPFHLHVEEMGEAAPEKAVRFFIQPFDLALAPLFRAGCFYFPDGRILLMVDMHHIISDRASMTLLSHEFITLFNGGTLPEPTIRYVDYAVLDHDYLSSSQYIEDEAYWMDLFNGELPVLHLPLDRPRPPAQTFNGDVVALSLGKSFTRILNRFIIDQEATLFSLLLSALGTLLLKYTGQTDLVVGTAFSGRDEEELQSIVGMFARTVALRLFPEEGVSFRDFLRAVRNQTAEAHAHARYPFDRLINLLGTGRDKSRNSLFDIMLVVQNMGLPRMETLWEGASDIHPFFPDHGSSIVDLSVTAVEYDGDIRLVFEFNTDLFVVETVERFGHHLIRILESAVGDPHQNLARIKMLGHGETERLLAASMSGDQSVGEGPSIIRGFEEIADTRPYKTALCFRDRHLTYGILNRKANRLAGKIIAQGAGAGKIIPLMDSPGMTRIIGVLGILKSGNGFLPLDPATPDTRIAVMLEEVRPDLIVCSLGFEERVEVLLKSLEKDGSLVLIDDTPLDGVPGERPDIDPHPEDPAYVIYTSGSTGVPKGIVITHENLDHYVRAFLRTVPLSSHDIVLQQASFSFDTFIEEVFPVLVKGGTLAVFDRGPLLDARALSAFILDKGVSLISVSPLLLNELNRPGYAEYLKHVRVIISGGDVLENNYMDNLSRTATIYNSYGPSETTVCATFHPCPREAGEGRVPIGTSLPGYRVYLLDRNREPVPVGVPGEICIAGGGTSPGYLGRPDLTMEKFVEDPFLPFFQGMQQRMFMTGDLGKRLACGAIAFMGRKDDMIKIRGYRIEPGDIIHGLLSHNDVADAFVTACHGENSLAAYVVPARPVAAKTLRRYLMDRLPAYMVPSLFIFLDRLPMTAHGKVDRKQLPPPQMPRAAREARPKTPVEIFLAHAWENVLKIKGVGKLDHFFDLGGDSITAMHLAYLLNERFRITINDIFKYPTIAELGRNIRERKEPSADISSRVGGYTGIAMNPVDGGDMDGAMACYQKKIKEKAIIHPEIIDKYRAVLITGSTGYFGAHIVRELIRTTTARVYLLVRSPSLSSAEEKVKDTFSFYFGPDLLDCHKDRLAVVTGDISEKNLGMTQSIYTDLSSSVDAVIHAAADVKHYGREEDFKSVNVTGTENLLIFAVALKKKDFYHISTVSVSLLHQSPPPIFTEFDIGFDTRSPEDNLYVRSKGEAETMAMGYRDKGISVTIYRVGNLTFHSRTGRF